jgi:hypothetical protein
MTDNWLEIPDESIDVEEIKRQVHERVARRNGTSLLEQSERPEDVAQALRREMIGDAAKEPGLGETVLVQERDCDIVPRDYVIDWRVPILGPIHAVVRRVINAEIRRYLFPSLEKQSLFNRKMWRTLERLAEENTRLRREIEELRRMQSIRSARE